jgi:hypothetical protein
MAFPTYQFGAYGGPTHDWFAWRPVRLWYGKWAWLRTVSRRRVFKKSFLDGPDWQFWAYDNRQVRSEPPCQS